MKPFVTVEKALELSKNSKDLLFIDTRYDFTEEHKGNAEYDKSHIPEAIFFNLEKDLSAPKSDSTGRHPLPPVLQFKELLESHGITKSHHIICYDDSNGGFTARLWFMLSTLGFEKVQILEGGFGTWVKQDYPISSEPSTIKRQKSTIEVPEDWTKGKIEILSYEQVKELVEHGFTGLIDSRDPERFRGETISYDPIYGHIPGASNRWWKANITEEGELRDAKELKNEFGLHFAIK